MSKQHDLARRAALRLAEGSRWGNRDMGHSDHLPKPHQHMVGDRVHLKHPDGSTAKRGTVVFSKSGYGRQHVHVHWDGEQHPFHDRRPLDGKKDPKPHDGRDLHPGEG